MSQYVRLVTKSDSKTVACKNQSWLGKYRYQNLGLPVPAAISFGPKCDIGGNGLRSLAIQQSGLTATDTTIMTTGTHCQCKHLFGSFPGHMKYQQ
jgi:hypothetical protein